MRAVLDVNILISALLSREGASALLVSRWLEGEFELVVSDLLLAELERSLGYPKLRARIDAATAGAFVSVLREGATVARDPEKSLARSADPGDDYLLALAEAEDTVVVSGDRHLLDLAPALPVLTARAFLELLEPG